MCGRFFVPEDHLPPEIEALFREVSKNSEKPALGEVRPGQKALVLARNRSRSECRPFLMKWGFRAGSRMIINARSESAMEKEMFQDLMLERRCLIPFTSYFEWDHRNKPHAKMRIWPENLNAAMLAGIYRMENGESCFTVLTRSASDSISHLHDRMPVILPFEARNDWLALSLEDPAGYLQKHWLSDMSYVSMERQISFLS